MMGMAIEDIIGDYKAFFSDLLHKMKKVGIDISGMPMSHLLYRVVTVPEYEDLRNKLKSFCSEFVETQFNGRAVSVLGLKEPLLLEDGFSVSVIELPAPRLVHMYPSGLESIGVIVGKILPEFIKQYSNVISRHYYYLAETKTQLIAVGKDTIKMWGVVVPNIAWSFVITFRGDKIAYIQSMEDSARVLVAYQAYKTNQAIKSWSDKKSQ